MAVNFFKLINPDAEYISMKEIGNLFSPPISYVSLWKWQKDGKIKLTRFKLGSKYYYKKTEVIAEIERVVSPIKHSEDGK